MKICLINNLYKPYIRGGAEKAVEVIADELVESDHDIFVISTILRNQKSKACPRPRSRIKNQKNKQSIYYTNSLYNN